MAIQIQLRRGTAAQWATANTILALAELAVEIDTYLYKIGDGSTHWSDLPYGGIHGPMAGTDTHVVFNNKGIANGSASFTFNYSTNTLNISNNLIVSNTLTVSNTLIVSNTLTVSNTLNVTNKINLSKSMNIGNNIIFSSSVNNDSDVLGPVITLGDDVNSTVWYAPQGTQYATDKTIFFANSSLIQVGNSSSYFNLYNNSLSFTDGDGNPAGFINVKKIYANSHLGTVGQILSSNSSGGIFWGTALTNGSDTQVLFNDSSLTNGSSAFTFTKSSNTLNIENISTNIVNSSYSMKIGDNFILVANAENGGGFEKIGSAIVLGKDAANLKNGEDDTPWYAPQGGTFSTEQYLFFANSSLIQLGNRDSYFNLYHDSLSFYDLDGNINGALSVNTITSTSISANTLSILDSITIDDLTSSVTINSTSFSGISYNTEYVGEVAAIDVVSNTQLTDNVATTYANSVLYTDTVIGFVNTAITDNAATSYANSTLYTDTVIGFVNTAITDNAATSYANSTLYTDTVIGFVNTAITANAANAYSNAVYYTDTVIGFVNTAITANAANAYSNAVYYTDTVIGFVNTAITNNAATSYANSTLYTDTVVGRVNTAITANAANAYSNAVYYTDTVIGFVNTAITSNASTTYANSTLYTDTVVGRVNTAITSNAATTYANATTFSSNASNISTGTLGETRLPYRMDQSIRTTDNVIFKAITSTDNVSIGTGKSLIIGANTSIDFDTTTYKPAYQKGRMYWDNEEQTIVVYGDGTSSFEISMGQREWVRTRNSTANTISKGTPVYITGVHIPGNPVHGHHPTIAPGDASDYTKSQIIGITGEDIAPSAHGYTVVRGYVEGLDTSALIAGQRAHLGFSTPGTIVVSAPEYPNFPTDLGMCLTSDATVGTFYVDLAMHTAERFRTTQGMYVGGDLSVAGSLNVTGNVFTTSATNLSVSDNIIYLGGGDTVTTTFLNGGLNDMLFHGVYEGASPTTYYVKITSAIGNVDKFSWSKDNFVTTIAANVTITTASYNLDNGISIKFNDTKGHTLGDKWTGTGAPINVDLGLVGNYNEGTYYHTGMFRDASDGVYKFFQGYTPEPDAAVNIDTGHASFGLASVQANNFTGNLVGTATNSSNLGGLAASGYQTTAGLAANVATLTSNNSTYAFGKTESNLNVNNATYAFGKTEGAINANNAGYLGSIAASSYQLNSTLNANIASYLPTYTGVVNASSLSVGSNFVANSTEITFTNYRISANGVYGTDTQVLKANSTGGVFWGLGVSGYTGSQGVIGYTGSQGYSGSQGYYGSVGFVGSKGDIGYAGSVGFAGSQGYYGSVGFVGSKGDIGYAGSVGYVGSASTVAGYAGSVGVGYTGSAGGGGGGNGYTGSAGLTATTVRQQFTGDGTTTSFTVSGGYSVGTISVFLNGVMLRNGTEVTVTSETDVVFTSAPPNGALIDVLGGLSSSVGAGYTGSQGDLGYAGSKGYVGSQGVPGEYAGMGYTGSFGYAGSAANFSLAAIQTSNFTATVGNIYPVNTSGGAVVVTLPASPTAGQQIAIFDYAGTSAANNITIYPNANKFQGATSNIVMGTPRESAQLVYVDSIQGWCPYGTFAVNPFGAYTASYLIVGGGGGGGGGINGSTSGGGGGAGGLLTGSTTLNPGTTYNITVGAGGAAGTNGGGTNGANSVAFSQTAIGGGYGGGSASQAGGNGGSGGGGDGGGANAAGGSGTVGQGNAGGAGLPNITYNGGGGGGASAAGVNGGAGGAGSANSITGSSVTYAGGGGGGGNNAGGAGGGGQGGNAAVAGYAGSAAFGGGGGGSNSGASGGNGGYGVVIVSVPSVNFSGVTTGAVTTSGTNKIITFTSSGTLTG